jgi:hypothetical protein
MTELITTLEGVVRDFVSSLSVAEQEAVRGLILNPQVRPSLDWYRRIVTQYLQGPSAGLLIEDIARKYADEAVWRDLDSPQGLPLFEAGIILRKSQTALSPTGA